VIVIDRGAPRTLAVGQRTPEGVLLVSVDSSAAVLEVDGKRERLEMGQHFATEASGGGSRQSVTLAADERGHFMVEGSINGGHVRFLVDTGATMISLSSAEADRLGVDYRKGQRAAAVMADGRRVPSYRVKLDSVTIGDMTLLNVDASVHESAGMGMALLGMSFLNRTEMRRDGATMTLIRRY
jgi:aspartyl protease family protein